MHKNWMSQSEDLQTIILQTGQSVKKPPQDIPIGDQEIAYLFDRGGKVLSSLVTRTSAAGKKRQME